MPREHPYTHQQNTASFQPRSPLRQPFNPNGWNQPTSHSTSTLPVDSSDSDWLNLANQNHRFFSSGLEHETQTAQLTPSQWTSVGNDIQSGLKGAGQLAQVTNNPPFVQARDSTDQTNNIAWEGGRAIAAGADFIEPGRWLAERTATGADRFQTSRLARDIDRQIASAQHALTLVENVKGELARPQPSLNRYIRGIPDPTIRQQLMQLHRQGVSIDDMRSMLKQQGLVDGRNSLRGYRESWDEIVRSVADPETRQVIQRLGESGLTPREIRGKTFGLFGNNVLISGVTTRPDLVRNVQVAGDRIGFQPRSNSHDKRLFRDHQVLFHQVHADQKGLETRSGFRLNRAGAVSQPVCFQTGGCGGYQLLKAVDTRRVSTLGALAGSDGAGKATSAWIHLARPDGKKHLLLPNITPQQRSAIARGTANELRQNSRSRLIAERLRDTRSQGTNPFRNNSGAQSPQTPRTSGTQARTGGTRPSRPPGGNSGGQAPRSGGTQPRTGTRPPGSNAGGQATRPGGTQARTGGTRPSRPPGGTARTQPPQAVPTGSGNPRPPGSGGNAPRRRPPSGGSSPRVSGSGASAAMKGVRRLGIAGQIVGLGMDAVDIKRAVDRDGGKFGKNAKQATTKVAGGLAGGAAGAAAGAAIGAAFGGVGAVPGAAIGFALGTAGSYLGSKGGEKLGKKLFK